MKKLNGTTDNLDKIISLYEVESSRKPNLISSIWEKIKAWLSIPVTTQVSHSKSTATSTPTSVIPTIKITEQAGEIIEADASVETEIEEPSELFVSLEEEPEFDMQSLKEFFNNNLTPEQEQLFQDLLAQQQQTMTQANFDNNEKYSKPQFAESSYIQRIQNHAQRESQNEDIWRRRQSILNGGGSHRTSESSDSLTKK